MHQHHACSTGTIVIEAAPVRYGAAGYAPRAKVTPFAGDNGADVRKTAGAPSPQASFSNELGRLHRVGLVAIDVLVGVDTFPLLNLHSDMLDAETTS